MTTPAFPSESTMIPSAATGFDVATMRADLERKRTALMDEIHAKQDVREMANERIKECRAELATVNRMINATTPRKRSSAE